MSSLPDPGRPDAGAALFSTWRVGDQAATLDAIAAVWRSRAWPSPGPLSYAVFPGADGATLLHYTQWTDEDAYRAYVRTRRDERFAEIDAAAAGIERLGLGRYRHHRSIPELPGAAASFEVLRHAGPDALAWADAQLDGPRPADLLVAHAHLGADGALVLRDRTVPPTGAAFGPPLHLHP